MAVANHDVNALERRDLFRSALSIAPGNDNPSLGTHPPNAPQISAGVAVGLSGNAASVENYNSCVGRIAGRRQSSAAQSGGDGLAIGTARAATEILNVIFCHVNKSINGIDAQARGRRVQLLSCLPLP